MHKFAFLDQTLALLSICVPLGTPPKLFNKLLVLEAEKLHLVVQLEMTVEEFQLSLLRLLSDKLAGLGAHAIPDQIDQVALLFLSLLLDQLLFNHE